MRRHDARCGVRRARRDDAGGTTRGPAYAWAAGAAAMTLTRRPWRSNCTTPAVRANSVSSLARLTFRPGWYFVPRWRTMMLPAVTASPADALIPSRCDVESRPLRTDP